MKKNIKYFYLIPLTLILTGGLVAMGLKSREKCLFEMYFIRFDTETYVPVTKDSIETDAYYRLGFYREHEFCNNLKELLESQPVDLKIDNRVIRLKFKNCKNGLVYYVDRDGTVEKNNKQTYKLDKAAMEKITTEILYFSGVVDYTVLLSEENN